MERKIALLFDPYLDTLGGGERYILTVASLLSQQNYQVILAWHNLDDLRQATSRFGINLDAVEISEEHYRLFTSPVNLLDKRRALKDFDLIFFVSDGSIPFLFSKNNLLHYQVPFTKSPGPKFLYQLKLLSIQHLIVNSDFTKKVTDRTLSTDRCQVIYPPVDTASLTNTTPKEKLILNVGRFASPSHSKRQDILISAFRQLVDGGGLHDWKLILAGGQKNDDSVLPELKDQARGYPIDFIVNPDYLALKKIYAKSTLYWHAAGYDVDENLNPEAVEHFGITTVEAMAAGCVPLVIDKGGQREILTPDSGFLVTSIEQLAKSTHDLIAHPAKLKAMRTKAVSRAQNFSVATFTDQFLKLL